MANSRINENRRTYRTTDTALLVKTEMFETDQIYYKTNLIHLKALKSTTKVLLLSNHQQIMMMIVGTGLVCGALPFQILDLRNAASKCVEIFSK